VKKRTRRSFSSAYKTEVIDLVRASGKSLGAVAKELGLTETAVRAWVRQAAVAGGRGRWAP
jgi:transposase